MDGFVKLIGIIMIMAGVVFFVKPNSIKNLANFFVREKWIYFWSVVSFIIGIIFLRAASQCAVPWLVTLFGVISLIKGIAIFALGQQKIKSMLHTLTKQPLPILRIYALVEIVLGTVLVYSV